MRNKVQVTYINLFTRLKYFLNSQECREILTLKYFIKFNFYILSRHFPVTYNNSTYNSRCFTDSS